MPIYEYECECGAVLEIFERSYQKRDLCGDECKSKQAVPASIIPTQGRLTRCVSASQLRGMGKEAKEETIDPVKRANRPYSDCRDE